MFKRFLAKVITTVFKPFVAATVFITGVSAGLSALPSYQTYYVFIPGQTPLMLPASAIPANALPSNALPSSALPSSAIPSNFFAYAIPSNVLKKYDAIPANALPANAIPSNFGSWGMSQVRSSAIPSNAIPSNAIPANIILNSLSGYRLPPSETVGWIRPGDNSLFVQGAIYSTIPLDSIVKDANISTYHASVNVKAMRPSSGIVTDPVSQSDPPSGGQSGSAGSVFVPNDPCTEKITDPKIYAGSPDDPGQIINITSAGGFIYDNYTLDVGGGRTFSCELFSENRLICSGAHFPAGTTSVMVTLRPVNESCVLLSGGVIIPASSGSDLSCPAGEEYHAGWGCCTVGCWCDDGCYNDCPNCPP
jgi:hypothetical protein